MKNKEDKKGAAGLLKLVLGLAFIYVAIDKITDNKISRFKKTLEQEEDRGKNSALPNAGSIYDIIKKNSSGTNFLRK